MTGGWGTKDQRSLHMTLRTSIPPGMLRRLGDDEIAEEIRTALLAAVADHRRQYVRLRVEHFGSPVGAAGATDTTGPSWSRCRPATGHHRGREFLGRRQQLEG